MNALLVTLLLVLNQTFDEKIDPLGKWEPVSAQNEFGEDCEEDLIEDFWIQFLPEGKYLMQEKNWNDGPPLVTEGTYTISSDYLNLTPIPKPLNYTSLTFPILEFTKDTLVLDYCMCATTTDAEIGRVNLIRAK